MKFFYLDKPINWKKKDFGNSEFFSGLSFAGSSLGNRVQHSIKDQFDFEEILSINDLDDSISSIIWSSNIIFLDTIKQKLFLRKLKASSYELFFGDEECFIFIGMVKNLKRFLTQYPYMQNDLNILHIPKESNLFALNKLSDYQHLLTLAPQAREFNLLSIQNEWVTKRSSNIKKLYDEYSFFLNLPKRLNRFFPTVCDYHQDINDAYYKVEYIDGLDLAVRYVNQGLDKTYFKLIYAELESFFKLTSSIKPNTKLTARPIDFILTKNSERFKQALELENFEILSNFIKNHTIFDDFQSLADLISKALVANEKEINRAGFVYSHGDLCFSNIILENDKLKLKFIDPRGGVGDKVFLSPYYDFAKLSHSILGGYDYILSEKARMHFDSNMIANISIDSDLLKHSKGFNSLAKAFNLDIKLIRLVEASLFLSMLPLHAENTKRIVMLAIRSADIMADFLKDKI